MKSSILLPCEEENKTIQRMGNFRDIIQIIISQNVLKHVLFKRKIEISVLYSLKYRKILGYYD